MWRDKVFLAIGCSSLTILFVHDLYAKSDTELIRRFAENIEKVRTAEPPAARRDAAEQLVTQSLKVHPKDVDDKTLADLIALLDTWDDSVQMDVARSLGNLGPRAKVAGPALFRILPDVDCTWGDMPAAPVIRDALTRIGETPPPPPTCETKIDAVVWNQRIKDTVAKVRSSESPVARARAAIHLNYLTGWLGRKDVDDEAIAGLLSLLDIPDEPVRIGVTAALGNVGPRARKAIPKLKELAAEVGCRPSSTASAENIRYALSQMGVKPLAPNCNNTR